MGETLNQLLDIESWTENSWEMFNFNRFNEAADRVGFFEMLLQREEAAKRDNVERGVGTEQNEKKDEKDVDKDN